eukprot:m.224589 g.224589  ORF g.224589 m.224589 type:complete len:118 (+) comp17034_c2_seq11:205-558(+)
MCNGYSVVHITPFKETKTTTYIRSQHIIVTHNQSHKPMAFLVHQKKAKAEKKKTSVGKNIQTPSSSSFLFLFLFPLRRLVSLLPIKGLGQVSCVESIRWTSELIRHHQKGNTAGGSK